MHKAVEIIVLGLELYQKDTDYAAITTDPGSAAFGM